MDKLKKALKVILFLPLPITVVLLLVSVCGMLLAIYNYGDEHPLTIGLYALAFYSLLVFCLQMPKMVAKIRDFKNGNKYIGVRTANHRLRVNALLVGNVLWNGAYGALQLGMGIYHRSAWFCSLAAYYACLVLVRLYLLMHTVKYEPGKYLEREVTRYRNCGIVFLVMNLALSAVMLYMIRENRVTRHSEITTIAMAAYTFFTFAWAVVSIFKRRKYSSPVLTAAGTVSLTAACVSMLSLENTMLNTFGGEMPDLTRRLFLSLSGGAISLFIVVTAVYMIVNAKKKFNDRKT